jgi:DNA-directed RNA polymerase specialized sigma24 family protein
MTAPGGPDRGLAELYELFGKLRQTIPVEARREMAFQVVLHPAAMKRLSAAASRLRRRLAHGPADFEELRQEAVLRLVRSLSSESLPFRDLGLQRFACWYWTLCTNASLQALQKCNRSAFQSLDSLEEEDQPLAPGPTPAARRWEDVLLAISQIRHRTMKAVMADMAAGIKVCESAAAHQISIATVSKMRQQGVEVLRGRCRREAVGQD